MTDSEGVKGQVQMIYLDPPYGIKYNSSWQIRLNDRNVKPAVDRAKLRVAGPFTVETLQSYEPLAPEDVAEASLDHERLEAFQERVFEHLKTAGVKNGNGARNEMAVVARVNTLPDSALHAEGYYDTADGEQKAYLHLGPQLAQVSRQAVNDAVKACRARGEAQWLLILGFAFESDVENSLQTQRAGSFRVDKARSLADIAYWRVDDDYDGSSFMVRQVFFCGGDHDEFARWQRGLSDVARTRTRKKLENTLKIEIDDEAFSRLYGFVSHPIPLRPGKRVAVRVVSQFGEESTKVLQP
jgi:hypothetical protein